MAKTHTSLNSHSWSKSRIPSSEQIAWPHRGKPVNRTWKIISSEEDGWNFVFLFSCKLQENDFWLKDGLARALTLRRITHPGWEQVGYDLPERKVSGEQSTGQGFASICHTPLKLRWSLLPTSQEGFHHVSVLSHDSLGPDFLKPTSLFALPSARLMVHEKGVGERKKKPRGISRGIAQWQSLWLEWGRLWGWGGVDFQLCKKIKHF